MPSKAVAALLVLLVASGCAQSAHLDRGAGHHADTCPAPVPELAAHMSPGRILSEVHDEVAFARRDASATVVALCTAGSRFPLLPNLQDGLAARHPVGGMLIIKGRYRVLVTIFPPTRNRRLLLRTRSGWASILFGRLKPSPISCPRAESQLIRLLRCQGLYLARWISPIRGISANAVEFLEADVTDGRSGGDLGFFQESVAESGSRLVLRFAFRRPDRRLLCFHIRGLGVASKRGTRLVPLQIDRCFTFWTRGASLTKPPRGPHHLERTVQGLL